MTPPLPPSELQVRAARPADLVELEALLARCSAETAYRRFHGALGPIVRNELARIARSTPEHRSWVATDGRAIHGTATLARGANGVVEAAFLVEDAWFRRGLGRRLFDAVAAEARRSGVESVTLWVQADNERARRFLRAMVPGTRTAFAGGGELEVEVPVAARPVGAAPHGVGRSSEITDRSTRGVAS